jgi:hypothetical protein
VVLDGWVKHHRRDFDIAMLILNQEIGEQVGWMGFRRLRPPAAL